MKCSEVDTAFLTEKIQDVCKLVAAYCCQSVIHCNFSKFERQNKFQLLSISKCKENIQKNL